MLDAIDTYLLNHGMPRDELCAIKRRRLYYTGILGFSALTLLFAGLIAFT